MKNLSNGAVLLAAVAFLSLAACSSGSQTPAGKTTGSGLGLEVPPASLDDTPAPAPEAVIVEESVTPGGEVTVEVEEEVARSPVRGPDGGLWKKEGASQTQHQADIEACFDYAWAQTRHDARISDDSAAARGNLASTSSSLNNARRRADLEGQKRRLQPLMEDCMTGRGYLRI